MHCFPYKSAFQNPVGDKLVASNSVRISASIPSFRGVLIPLHTSSDGFEMRSKWEGPSQPGGGALNRFREVEDLRSELKVERDKGLWRRLFGK